MISAHPTACLRVDLGALAHNHARLVRLAAAAEVAPVVKADAYGLGIAHVAPHLLKQGARTFFVARLDEGIALRKVLGAGPIIYVLDGLRNPDLFISHDLRPVINSPEQYRLWLAGPDSLIAALHIDTGMSRLGVRPDDVSQLPARMGHHLALVMSHLACADTPDHPQNRQQLTAFTEAAQTFPKAVRSLANSGGVHLGADYHVDLVRPGVCLYGGGPFGTAHADIQPVAHLSARVMQVRHVGRGETIGYGAGFIAPHDMQIATLGLGYADGLPRSFSASGFATLKGERRALTGRISMDVFSLDVTGLEVTTDDWAELLGANQNLDEVAQAAGTISYELLTQIGARVAREYR